MTSRRVLVIALAVSAGLGTTWWLTQSPSQDAGVTAPEGRVVQTVRTGDLDVVLLSPSGSLTVGRNKFAIEFRAVSGGLVDVGAVTAGATMGMPGMTMSGNLQVTGSGVPGRYAVTADFGMAGSWPMRVDWDGPAGRGSVNIQGTVQ